MSRLDDLPPDQRAALSLLLRQGKGYAEVAKLLKIGERAVHDRAHAALAVLAPREARTLSAERREEIGDYLLGQRPGLGDRLRTRSLLDGSAPAQAWAKAVAEELTPLAPGALPEIPDAGPPGEGDRASAGQPDGPGSSAVSSAGRSAARAAAQLPSSRVGGAILLAAIAAIIVVVVLLTTGGGGGHRRTSSANGARASTTTPRASETKRLTLTSPNPSGRALGVAAVLQEGSTYAFYLAAEHLPPSKGFFYAVWLYNSPTSFEALSKSPAVGSDGRLQGGALLPADAGNYHQMIVTKETNERPTRPGAIVLRGSFGLH
jgi:sigma-70-like protein